MTIEPESNEAAAPKLDRSTSSPKRRPGRKYTTTACHGCRRKRIKCEGSPPCASCTKLNLLCRFDGHSDRRTKAVKRQSLEKAENDHRMLSDLLEILRDVPPAHAAQIESIVRRNTSDQEYPSDERDEDGRSPSTNSFTVSTVYDSPRLSNDTPVFRGTPQGNARTSINSVTQGRGRLLLDGSSRSINDTPGTTISFSNSDIVNVSPQSYFPADTEIQQSSVMHVRPETSLPLHVHNEIGEMARFAANAVFSFQNAARSQIIQGFDARRVLSMDVFDLDLFYRDRVLGDGHTVAGWACEWGKIWVRFPVELRLASVHYVGSLMRWLIMPCKETYELMSPLIRPLPCQLTIPHTIDIDLWGGPPVMRELQLMYGHGWIDHASTDTQRLHWRHGVDACTETITTPCDATALDALPNGQGGYHRLTKRFAPHFIAHIDKAESWTVHRDLLTSMPELQGRVEFHDG